MNELQALLRALACVRVPPISEEYEIHAEIARALEAANITFIHEYRLGSGRRIDFLCGSVGIEIKKRRPSAPRLREQLTRYLESEALTAVVVVMQKPCFLPKTILNKPVYSISLDRLWGVALP